MNEARKIALKSLEENDRQTRVVTADSQTDGKGCGNHKWKTMRGSLAYTMVTFPKLLSHETGREIMVSQIAMVQTLKGMTDKDFFLRWPNDIWSADGKVGGILGETLCRGPSCSFMNIGVGLNVFASPNMAFTDKIFNSRARVTRKEILSNFIAEFNRLQTLVMEESDGLQKLWNRFNYDSNKKIKVDQKGEFIFSGIDRYGSAILNSTKDDSKHIFNQGSVKYEKH
ncbi:MAG: biotin--[acetyl-CoA-carboxylase] ligase [Treponema sp.]|nr:biotin--[acetyl-CoA-carboxylase] ligase [Treponema sp.]